ncbi:S1/P1 nuclease [Persicobacter psychrovividus]|uniref:Endonuclease n=1 Tax=Persicobacter psychrovividus TaxID=387638 RepID=A0ABM7VE38_9BACT|nr:endonuclease [Persicobacter psychrovividus]
MKKLNVLAVLMLFAVGQVFAWGQNGHRTVAEVASHHISKKTQKAIIAILGDENMAMAATWPDEIKSDHAYDSCKVYHYVNMKSDETYAQSEKNPHGDAITALQMMSKIVKDKTQPLVRRQEALRYIIHIIGDIHQPMHVGHKEDLGGNLVKVKWFGHKSNLHRVWDSDMIDNTQLSYTELSRHVGVPTKAEIKNWQSSSVEQWVAESHQVATKLYDTVGDGNFSYRYMFDHRETLYNQLEKGGVRLAGYLNALFG